MSRIEKIYDKVLKTLEEIPETRGNDNLLIVTVDSIINPAVAELPYGLVMKNRALFGLPNCETIRRSRQKAQENFPELKPSKAIQDIRLDEKIEYENFAVTV